VIILKERGTGVPKVTESIYCILMQIFKCW